MAHVITDDCASCGGCVEACPNEAITEQDDKYAIDAEKCDDCASCTEACPTDAIVPA
jgi:ferredoxin